MTKLFLIAAAVLLTSCAATPPKPVPAKSVLDTSGEFFSDVGTPNSAAVRGMTFEELQACALESFELSKVFQTVTEQMKELNAAQERLKQEGVALDSERTGIDATSKNAVDTYNSRIEAHRNDIKNLNKIIATFESQKNSYNTRIQKQNLDCANRPYRSTDVDKLAPDIRQAWQKHKMEKFDMPVYFPDETLQKTTQKKGGRIRIGGSHSGGVLH
jgi:hypothetical protein